MKGEVGVKVREATLKLGGDTGKKLMWLLTSDFLETQGLSLSSACSSSPVTFLSARLDQSTPALLRWRVTRQPDHLGKTGGWATGVFSQGPFFPPYFSERLADLAYSTHRPRDKKGTGNAM